MLRSMQQAVYQPKNEGHFGLALSQYAHFTSPIRRYPDLLVHRAIKHVLKRDTIINYRYTPKLMHSLGESCSNTERRAEEATRDVVSWLKCEYMQDHIGSDYPGVITAVTSFGLFVELTDIHVEGLLHVTNLSHDYYRFEQAAQAMVGERTGKQYRLGDAIMVRVEAVNLEDRKIDFAELGADKRDATHDSRSDKKRKKPKKKFANQDDEVSAALTADQEKPLASSSTKSKVKSKKKISKKKTGKKTSAKKVTSKKTAAKKKATKKKATKKKATKKKATKKFASKKSVGKKKMKKFSSKKTVVRKTATKKKLAKKANSRKKIVKKTANKKKAAKKSVSKKTATKMTANKKVVARKKTAKKKAGKQVVSKRTAAKKTAASKVAAKKAAGKKR